MSFLTSMIQYRTLIKSLFGIPISVKDFGAVGNGTTDDTTAIQAAINRMEELGGGIVYLPRGTYKVTGTITIDSDGVYLVGEGWESKITRSTDYGDTFFLTGDDVTGTRLINCGIRHLYIESTGLTTSGAHIHFNGVQKMLIDHIWMQDGFKGITFNGCGGGSHISKIYLVFTSLFGGAKTGRRYFTFGNASGAYAHPPCGDLFITDFNLRGYTTDQNIVEYGVEILSADGVWFENGHIGNASDANIIINGSTSENLSLVYVSNVMTDEGNGYGCFFDGTASAEYHDIKFVNCTFKGAGTGTYGIATSATCEGAWVRFIGCSVEQFKYDGVAINSAAFKGILFNGCSVHGNAKDTGASSSGYYFGAGAQMVTISGGNSGRNSADATTTGLQAYGVEFSSGHSNILISGVDLTGNVSGSTLGGSNGVRVTGCSVDAATIASATQLAINASHTIFSVSGTTTITSMTTGPAGRMVTLVFQGVLTFTDGGNLKLNGDFVTTADDSITLISDGTNWIEIARSAN